MRSIAIGGLLAVLLHAAPACADSIDGHWCNDASHQRMEINGASIVTPTGARMSGDYSRHYFSYVDGSKTIAMTLVNEMTVQLRVGDDAAETWRRCGPPTSFNKPLARA